MFVINGRYIDIEKKKSKDLYRLEWEMRQKILLCNIKLLV